MVEGEGADESPVVWYVQTRCPACDQARPHVVSTRGRVRWHKCQRCGATFKSVEAARDSEAMK
jgi:transposase-like protein